MSETNWEPYFGFETPYPNQADVVERIVETARQSGYLAMEGPCGTGKTMAALTAAAYLLRETDDFDNAVVATPVKQQRQQFVEDLRTLNAGLDDPLSGVALVGKRDLCPYGREDVFPEDSSVHERCRDLRETTADLVADDGDGSGSSGFARDAADDSLVPDADADDDVWWDSQRARELAEDARRDSDLGERALRTAGRDAPYPRTQPAATTDAGTDRLYCPFEADWYARDKASPVTFAAGENHVVTSEEFLPLAVEAGTCPHRVMSVLLQNADVVVGNYNHLFDTSTRNLTERVLDENTLVIVDEAHRVEERVRDLLSDTVGHVTVRQAREDLRVLVERAAQSSENREAVESHLAHYDVPFEAVRTARRFYDAVDEWFEERVHEELADRFDGYPSGFADRALPREDLEIQLRDPERSETDEFTRWVDDSEFDGSLLRVLSRVGLAAEETLEALGEDRECVCTAVGALFGQWWERDHTEYFREISLEHSERSLRDPNRPWLNSYNASLVMYNCMPARKVKEILEDFGGGVLMSATLEPLSVFEDVTGLTELATDEERPRVVDSRTYGLTFPEENRASWILDVEAFTQRNRGAPRLDNENPTRERYAYVARLIAESRGNVMLCWPNYAEAEWAADRLRREIDKPVLLDESSSHEHTRDLKREFVAGDPKVLVTSTRGTLTEGVDYEGEQLHACAVFGVPLVNIGSPRVRAVQHAYGDRFGEDKAFAYALTVPAVRRVRQALGRVIRGPDERGVRIVVGRRFVPGAIHSVYEYFPEAEREEFVRMKPEFLASQFEQFWS